MCYIVGDNGTILKTSNVGGLGLNETQSSYKRLKIYPNPASDYFMVDTFDQWCASLLIIYNPWGKVLITKMLEQCQSKVDISSLKNGVYILKLKGESSIQIGKIIKK